MRVTIMERIVKREQVEIERNHVTLAVFESVFLFPSKEMKTNEPDLTNHLFSFKHTGQLCHLARHIFSFTAQVHAGARKVATLEVSSPSQVTSKNFYLSIMPSDKILCLSLCELLHLHLCLSLLIVSPL